LSISDTVAKNAAWPSVPSASSAQSVANGVLLESVYGLVLVPKLHSRTIMGQLIKLVVRQAVQIPHTLTFIIERSQILEILAAFSVHVSLLLLPERHWHLVFWHSFPCELLVCL